MRSLRSREILPVIGHTTPRMKIIFYFAVASWFPAMFFPVSIEPRFHNDPYPHNGELLGFAPSTLQATISFYISSYKLNHGLGQGTKPVSYKP